MHPAAAMTPLPDTSPSAPVSRESRRRVLVTGGAGRIASAFATAFADDYDLTLIDLPGRFGDAHASLGTLVEADISRLDDIAPHFSGVDTIVHLGGERRPGAPWKSLLPANVIGTYNVIAAAMAADCRRLVYASSVHAVSGYPATKQLRETDPARAGDLYGATKCWGEALGSAAAAEGLSFVALRIGAVEDTDMLAESGTGWMVRDYCAPDDLIRLMRNVIEREDITFEIFNAVSGGPLARLSMDKSARLLGFAPASDAVALTPALHAAFAQADLSEKTFESGFRDDVAALRGAPRA